MKTDITKTNNAVRANSLPNKMGGADPWVSLQALTDARIAIGRSGGSQRTPSILDFRLAHARARDAVFAPFDAEKLASEFKDAGFETLILHTKISDKSSYLMNPEGGKELNEESKKRLCEAAKTWDSVNFALIVSDGLSATAANENALETVSELVKQLPADKWKISPIMIIPFARVKIQDYIGQILGVRHSLVLIGERPGLGSPDSLSAYFTYKPRWESVESDRNCISNIRMQGMPLKIAARKLALLLGESLRLGIGGTALKDNIDDAKLLES